MKRLGLVAVLFACSSSSTPGTIAIHTPSGLLVGIQLAVTDLALDLDAITGADIDGGGPDSFAHDRAASRASCTRDRSGVDGDGI